MKIYMYYLGKSEVKRMEMEAVVNEYKFLGSTHYTLAEPFPLWAMRDVFSYDFNKVRNSNGKNNGVPFVLSDSPDMIAAIRLFQTYLLDKVEEKEKQIAQMNAELGCLLTKSGNLCNQIDSVRAEQERQEKDQSERLAWTNDLRFSDVWDKGGGIRAIYFDGPATLLEKFLKKEFPEAKESDICLEYYLDNPTKTCCATISPVRITEDGSKESYDTDYIDLSFEEIATLISIADAAIKSLSAAENSGEELDNGPDEAMNNAPLGRDAAGNPLHPGNDEEP